MDMIPILDKLFKNGQWPSAVLFEGPTSIALKKAQQLIGLWFCEQHSDCGACSTCKLRVYDHHPDLHVIRPHQAGHAIKIEQIRELNDKSHQHPQLLPFQLVVIEHADTMNGFAANALLKTLEEPTPNFHFILLVENATFLPKTLLSRCWKIKLDGPLALHYQQVMEEDMSEDKAKLISSFAQWQQLLLDYVNDKMDMISLVRRFDGYALDDILWFLQYLCGDLIQDQLLGKNEKNISITRCWLFWDGLTRFRKQVRTQSSLNASLVLSRLFLLLHGEHA